MNDPAIPLVDWLTDKGEIDLGSTEDTWIVAPNRIPSHDGFDIEQIDSEQRNLINLNRLDIESGLGVELNPSQRARIFDATASVPQAFPKPNIHVLAWYQPIHYYGLDWGIFITSEGILELAQNIAPYVKILEKDTPEKLVLSSFYILYHHEQFHHRIESAAIRMHVIEQKPCYRKYTSNVYNYSQAHQLSITEEKLAMADMYRKINSNKTWKKIGSIVKKATQDFLLDLFLTVPPAYLGAKSVIKNHQNLDEMGILMSNLQEFTLTPARNSFDWRIASGLTKSLYSFSQNIWEITSSAGSPVLPRTFPLSVSRKRIENALRHHGFVEIRSKGKGSHVKWKGPSGEMTVLPLGKEIFGSTASSIAKTLKMSVQEFEKF